MRGSISLGGLPAGRVPAVVLGDLTLVRPHGMVGIPVVVATADPHDVALRSRFVNGSCILPEGPASDETVRLLLALGKRIRAVCGGKAPLVYGRDRDLEMILDHREALSEYYLFTTSSDSTARALLDKERFYEVAEAAGVPVPRTRKSGGGAGRGLADLREPLVVKPRKKAYCAEMQGTLFTGGAKARVFATRKDLLEYPGFARFEADLVIQEYIPGDVGALVSFHGLADAAGVLLASFCGRKLRTFPQVAGESSFIELTKDREVREVGQDAAARLGLCGPFKIDLLRDERTGKLHVLEINGRFNLWHYLGAVHGVNLPAIAYEYHLFGRQSNVVREYLPRLRWVDLYRDFKAFQEENRRGSLTLGMWVSSLARSRKVYDTFAWDDPAPMSGWVKDFLSRRRDHGALRHPVGHPR